MYNNRSYDSSKWRVYLPNGGFREFQHEADARKWFDVAFPPGTNAGLYQQVDRCEFIEKLTAGQCQRTTDLF